MRIIFGLAALLVVSGIVIFMMANSAEKVTSKGQQAKRDLGGITGRAPENATPGNTGGTAGGTANTGGGTANTGAGSGNPVTTGAPANGGNPAPTPAGARTPVANVTNREVRDIDKS